MYLALQFLELFPLWSILQRVVKLHYCIVTTIPFYSCVSVYHLLCLGAGYYPPIRNVRLPLMISIRYFYDRWDQWGVWSAARDDRFWYSNSYKSMEVQLQNSITTFASKELSLNRMKVWRIEAFYDKRYTWDEKLVANLVKIIIFLQYLV